jgi:ferredoxin-thioredoxin reductase catalytic subunit
VSRTEPVDRDVERAYLELKKSTEASGYLLHPDAEFARELVRGILINRERYGCGVCPCRLASGGPEEDRDIECPCVFRDIDLAQYGQCYCGLYVSEELSKSPGRIGSIPERRGQVKGAVKAEGMESRAHLSYPVWRCTVCGYLCARDEAPLVCPICKAKKERFERFL